ncbi:hypothetical protein [Qipengyuania marisflavi]|uniref:Uncharacterized protein n=1 Tax=Qipengyuania marisflavi TaxID=2486356 RepID=A0A5S3PBL1_9SPHN|nr:hypothetical protein [Qipengyuania marisflavi]TMM50145.1 hypothetical protein FEV51_02845 [Qipengyuania marisflavi]
MTKTRLAFIAIGLCSVLLLFQTWVLGDNFETPWFVWLPILGILGWSLWQLRAPPDPASKLFDFNPKRGLLYFFLGLLIFPLTLSIDAIFGADISMTDAALFTAGGSILIGLIGVFTEHVNV